MRRAATPCVLALALAALVAAPARAQRGAAEAPEKEKKPQPRLTLDLGGEEAYESNVPYTEVLGQDDFVTRGTGRLTAILPIRRGQVELGAEGGANVYRTVKGLDRYTWGFLGSVEHRLSRRADFKLEARSSHGYARDTPQVTVAGSLAPLTLVRNDRAEGSFRQRLWRTFELKLEGRGERFQFDSPLLQDGWSAGGRAGFENSFTPGFALGADVSYGQTATLADGLLPPGAPVVPGVAAEPRPGHTIEVSSAVATLRLRLARGVVLRAEGGAARFGPIGQPVVATAGGTASSAATTTTTPVTTTGHDPVPTAPSTTPTMAADLACTVGPHTLTAIASRRIEQTYGIGAIGVNRVLALEYRLALARRVTFLVQGADNHNSAPDNFLLSKGRTLTAGFDSALPADFTARLTYSYWDQQNPDRDWRSHTVALGLSKRFTWR